MTSLSRAALLGAMLAAHAACVGSCGTKKKNKAGGNVEQVADPGTGECTPSCQANTCGTADGCGGLCACEADLLCSALNECVDAASCMDTCAGSNSECGTVCGEDCGQCSSGQCSVQRKCVSATPVACDDCSLKLSAADPTVSDGKITGVVLTVDYSPGDGEPQPRLIDLRLNSDKLANVTLASAEAGDAVTSASKSLYTDPNTGNPWKVRTNDAGTVTGFQFLILATDNLNTVGAGRLLTLTFTMNDPGPILFNLEKREETFAPAEADAAIAGSGYDESVIVVVP